MKEIVSYLPVVSVILIYIARILELKKDRGTILGQIREQWTLKLFVLVGTFMLVGGIAEFFLRGRPAPDILFLAGWCVALLSFWIRRSAIATLGKFWSLHVEIRAEHELIRSGPFRWMRHPTYFSMILELTALGLICHAAYAGVVTVVLFVPALLARLRIEEDALIEKFGDRYRDYQKTTPAIFPYRVPKSS